MHVTHISNFNAATFRARKTFVESKSYVLLIKEFSLHLCFFRFLRRHSSLFKEALRIFLAPFPQTPLIYVPCTDHTIIYTLMYPLGKLLEKETVSILVLVLVDTKYFEMNGGKHFSKSICS
jgi:hypothetical protein